MKKKPYAATILSFVLALVGLAPVCLLFAIPCGASFDDELRLLFTGGLISGIFGFLLSGYTFIKHGFVPVWAAMIINLFVILAFSYLLTLGFL